MQNLPIFLDMRDRKTMVVGGGVVAARRAEFLLRAGARVTAFASELGEDFFELRNRPNFRHVAREPRPEDFGGCALVFVATEVQRARENALKNAKAAGALVNVADQPRFCDFIMPSIVDRSPLVVAISTGGASPILGRMLKARLESSHSRGLRASRRSDERVSGTSCRGDAFAEDAAALLGERARRPDRRGGALRKRPCGRGTSGGGNRASARGFGDDASRRGLSRRRRSGRSGSRHFPRLQAHAESRRRPLRPADWRGGDESRAARGGAHLCG